MKITFFFISKFKGEKSCLLDFKTFCKKINFKILSSAPPTDLKLGLVSIPLPVEI